MRNAGPWGPAFFIVVFGMAQLTAALIGQQRWFAAVCVSRFAWDFSSDISALGSFGFAPSCCGLRFDVTYLLPSGNDEQGSMGRTRIGLRDIRALPAGNELWDSDVIGFGVRRQQSDLISYIIMYRNADRRQRRYTIGRHGSPWTPDTARTEARRILGLVAAGGDPSADKKRVKAAMTVAELCDVYLQDAESGRILTKNRVAKKPSTIKTDRSRLEHHVKPLLGKMPVAAVTREDIERFMHLLASGSGASADPQREGGRRSSGGRGAATRTVGLLGGIFAYAVRQRMRNDNPVRGVQRYADGRRERRLSEAEYGKLGAGLRKLEANAWPPALTAARFLALTGWRTGEALNLQWSDLDIGRRTATLPDTKTGRSLRPLSTAACELLAALPRISALIFPSSRGTGAIGDFPAYFEKITDAASLPDDVTAHVLRHSFASLASDLGLSEPTIAALIGHVGRSMTSRYVHSADAVLLTAADQVAGRISALMVAQE